MTEVIGIDHFYIAVSDMQRSEIFYDKAFRDALGFRKNTFALHEEPHIHYYNRHFGYVIRPARAAHPHDAYSPGLHHLCLRVDTIAHVASVAGRLRELGIQASEVTNHPRYAPDYWATFFSDPDGIRLEITNFRQERRERYLNW